MVHPVFCEVIPIPSTLMPFADEPGGGGRSYHFQLLGEVGVSQHNHGWERWSINSLRTGGGGGITIFRMCWGPELINQFKKSGINN